MTTATGEQTPQFDVNEDGTIHVPAFDLPLSAALSAENKAMQTMILRSGMRMDMPDCRKFESEADFKQAVDKFRVALDSQRARPLAERLLERCPVRHTQTTLGGVPVEEFAPLEETDADRVLINLHGGAFISGSTHVGRIESIPLAHNGKFRVVSVDYRQAYEHKYPAATEDVVAVYTELLKSYSPAQIGIYGSSAGGVITAQAAAWIVEHELPIPGALGIFSAGTGGAGDGDYFAMIGVAQTPPFGPLSELGGAPVGYFSDTQPDDYLVNPILAPESLRAKFPPTLLITGTRSFDFSPALALHRALSRAGADAALHVFDGLGHCFFHDAATPESLEAYGTIIRFFRKHLNRC